MPTNSQQVAALTGGSLQPNVCSSQDQHRNAFKHFYDHGDSDATIVNYKIIMDQQGHAAVFHLETSNEVFKTKEQCEDKAETKIGIVGGLAFQNGRRYSLFLK